MGKFKDNVGREWAITIAVTDMKRVRALARVDLVECVTGDLWRRIVNDPVLLADVTFALVKPQADAAKVSDEDFGRSMWGGPLADALEALQDALTDVFPSHQHPTLMARYLEAAEEVLARIGEARKVMGLESRPPVSGDGPGGPPESSASTPAPSPSANST